MNTAQRVFQKLLKPQKSVLTYLTLMESSPLSDGEIKASMRRKKVRQFLYAIPLLSAAVMVGLLRAHYFNLSEGGEKAAMFLSVAVFIAVLVVNHFDWRCPLCKSYIGRSRASCCGTCGVPFM